MAAEPSVFGYRIRASVEWQTRLTLSTPSSSHLSLHIVLKVLLSCLQSSGVTFKTTNHQCASIGPKNRPMVTNYPPFRQFESLRRFLNTSALTSS